MTTTLEIVARPKAKVAHWVSAGGNACGVVLTAGANQIELRDTYFALYNRKDRCGICAVAFAQRFNA